MISVIEGPDYGRSKLLVKSITKDWPSIKVLWTDDKNWSELDATLFSEDYLIVKRAEKLGDRYAEAVPSWRYKNLIFITDKALKKGVFSRKSKRLGKGYSMALGKVAREKIAVLSDQLAIPPEMKMLLKTRCFSVSDALNAAECYMMTGEIPVFRVPPIIAFLSQKWGFLFDLELEVLLRHLSSLAGAVGADSKGWILLKKISKASPGAVGVIFNVYQKVKDDPNLRLFLLNVAKLGSGAAEEVGSLKIPTSYFLLQTQAFQFPKWGQDNEGGRRRGGFSFGSHAGTKKVGGWRKTGRSFSNRR